MDYESWKRSSQEKIVNGCPNFVPLRALGQTLICVRKLGNI